MREELEDIGSALNPEEEEEEKRWVQEGRRGGGLWCVTARGARR